MRASRPSRATLSRHVAQLRRKYSLPVESETVQAGREFYNRHRLAVPVLIDDLLRTDNVVSGVLPGFRELGIEPKGVDPRNALIKAYYSQYCYMDYNFDWVADLDQALKTSLEFAKQAVTLDDTDSAARWILCLAHLMMRNHEEARVHIERAVELNTNDTEARGIYGLFLTWIGESEKALEQFEIAKRHNPFDISWLPWVRGIAYFTSRRYGEAIESFNQIHDPNHEINYWLAASYAHAGRAAEASAKLQEFLRLAERDMVHFPGQNPQEWMNYLHRANAYLDRRDLDHLYDGLRRAGLAI